MSRARQGDPRPKAEIILHRDIAAGEIFTYAVDRPDDRVLIVGHVGAGAQVSVTAAEVEFAGSIGDGASMTFARPTPPGVKAAFSLAAPLDGLVVHGAVGHGVTLQSMTGIRLRGAAGHNLTAVAAGDVRALSAGNNACVTAGRELAIGVVGASARLTAGARACVTVIGADCTIQAKGIAGAKGDALPASVTAATRDIRVSPACTRLYNATGVARLRR